MPLVKHHLGTEVPVVPAPPMIPNFMAFQNRPEPENAAASTAARLLAEVPVFKAEKKSEVGTKLKKDQEYVCFSQLVTRSGCYALKLCLIAGRSRAWFAEKTFVWVRCADACLACIFFIANASTSGLRSRQVSFNAVLGSYMPW